MAYAIGDHIETDKGPGEVAYIGEPEFAEGVWVGVVLQQPNGKNNGIVKGKKYFDCPEQHGIFYKHTRFLEFVNAASAPRKSVSSSKLPTRSSAVGLNRQAGSSKTSPSLTPSESRESLSSRSRQSSFYGKPPGAPAPANGNSKLKRPGPSPKSTPEPEPVKESIPKDDENVAPSLLQPDNTANVTANTSAFGSATANDEDIGSLKAERDTLKEMLKTLKDKRRADTEKLKEFEQMKMKVSRLESHKDEILKEHSKITKQLQEAKKEIIDLKANAASAANQTPTDVDELLEQLTMEKETALAKNEYYEKELEILRQKIQDLEGSNGDVPTENGHHEPVGRKSTEPSSERVKTLEQAVLSLRDIIYNYDDQIKEVNNENQQLRDQLDHFQNLYEAMKAEVDERDKSISLLQEQIDAALGADKVIEDLTVKILDYEEKARESEQLASNYELTTRLFDELTDYCEHLKKEQAEKIGTYEELLLKFKHEADCQKNVLAESESLVIKFQRKVAEMNELLQEKEDEILRLQENLASSDGSGGGGFAVLNGTKAFADTVTCEVAQLELQYAKESIKYLSSFLPDNFFKAGSDSDLLHVHLSFPRIAAKTVLLRKLLRLKYPDVPGGVRREHVTKSHRAEQWASVERFEYALAALYTIVTKLNSITQGSTVERMTKLALQKHDIAQQEKQLDNYFDLLRNNNLDENTSTDCIDRATLFFTTCAFHLSTDTYDTTEFMRNTVAQFRAGFKWLQTDLKRLELALMPSELENGDFVGILTKFSELVTEADRQAIHVNNGLPTDAAFLINSELSDNLQSALSALDKVNKTLYKTCATVASKLSLSYESEGLLTSQMQEVFQNAVEQDYAGVNVQDASTPITEGLQNICAFFTELSRNVDAGQLQIPYPETAAFPPIVSRAQVRKEDAAEAESMRWEIKKKDTQIENLNKVVKSQINDLSTMRVRLEMTAQKVLASSDEAAAVKMEARLSEITAAHRAAIQEYIDLVQAREHEISELKEKLENGKTRDQFDSMQQLMNTLNSAGNGNSIGTNDLTTINKRNAALLMNLHKQKNNELLNAIQSLPPIRVSQTNVGMYHTKSRNPQNDIKLMLRQAHDLCNAMNVALVEKSVLNKGPCEKLNAINHQVDQLYSQFHGVIATIKAS